ncbi:MAG: GNAT family N-acetyltransferase [Terrisporobacter sp.]|uniref:GNAT family N-acetyltransferase n=1 Tax=Terrisporobacter sp. TaxID=1965305 RepID=UPI002FCA0679
MDSIFGYKILDSKYTQMKIIETPKFILRPATLSDASDFYEYFSQEKVVRYLPFEVHKNINDTKRFIKIFFINNYQKGKIGNYAIYHKYDKKVIGNIGVNNVSTKSKEGEIGICLNPKYWGNDFATELTVITLITGFELMNMEKLIALTYSANKYTPKSLESLGFQYIKTYKPKSSLQVSHRFELTRDEYLNMKKDYLPNLIKGF